MQYLPLIFLFTAVAIATYLYLHEATRGVRAPRKAQPTDPVTASPGDQA
jgi:hypothetical protein